MNNATPKTIPEYLDQLRYELRSADPALLQDALYDAEEYLRSELAENPGVGEAEMLARIATSYGAPEEVAAIYRETDPRLHGAAALSVLAHIEDLSARGEILSAGPPSLDGEYEAA